MKKVLVRILVSIVCCVALSAIIESLGFNFNAVFKKPESFENLSYSKIVTEDTDIINIDLTDKYINKFVIDYETSSDIEYELKYSYYGMYGNIEEATFTDIFDDSFNKAVTNIDKTVSDISIEYKRNSKSDKLGFNNISVDNAFHFNLTRAVCIFLVFSLLVAFFFFYKDGFRSEKLHIYFAITCSLVGAIAIVAQPSATFYSWDDQIHFQNTIDIFTNESTYSIGEFNSTDANVENSAGKDSIDSIEEQHAQNQYFNSGLSPLTKTTSWLPSYGKIAYVPMSIGYHLAKLVNLPFSACFKIGKLFNLIFYILLVAYAIKTIKIGKGLLTIVALLPTSIFLASNYSYDPAVFAGISIFFAHLTNLYLDKNSKFNFKTAVIMFAAISLACLTKAVYAPILLLALFIPKSRFESSKQSLLAKIGIVGMTLILSATFVLPAISGSTSGDPRGGNTSLDKQLSLVLSHPTDYAKLLGDKAVAEFGTKFTNGFFGFAYIENPAKESSANFLYILLFTIFFIFFTDNKGNELSKKHRAITTCVNLGIVVLIWTALYLTFTPVGSNTIEGVQNRYFLPLLAPLLIYLQPKNIVSKISPKVQTGATIIVPALIAVIMFLSSILAAYSY